VDRDELERRIGEILNRWPEVAFAYLFGSRARGDAGARSDVDVAISINSNERAPRVWFEVVDGLAAALKPLEVDCILLNGAPLGLRFSIVRDGLVVLDRAPAARRAFEVATRREYWDWEPYRRRHDEALFQSIRDGTYGTRPRDDRPLATR